MLYPEELRIRDIIRRWNLADELYQDLRSEAEQAIQEYDEMERMYEDASYYLHEAEERIAELEAENERLLQMMQKQVFFARPFWRKLQNIFGGSCTSILEVVAATHYGRGQGAGHHLEIPRWP